MGFLNELLTGVAIGGKAFGEAVGEGYKKAEERAYEEKVHNRNVASQVHLQQWLTGQKNIQEAGEEERIGEFLAGAGVDISPNKRLLAGTPEFKAQMPGESPSEYLYGRLTEPGLPTRPAPTRVPKAVLPYLSKLMPGGEKKDNITMTDLYVSASQGDPGAKAALDQYAKTQGQITGAKIDVTGEKKPQQPQYMSEVEQKEHFSMTTRASRLEGMKDLFKRHVKGTTIGGVGPGAGLITGAARNLPLLGRMLSSGQQLFHQEMDEFASEMRHERFGGALSPHELALSRQFIPGKHMSEQQIEASMEALSAVYNWSIAMRESLEGVSAKDRTRAMAEFRKENPFPLAHLMTDEGGAMPVGTAKSFKEKYGSK